MKIKWIILPIVAAAAVLSAACLASFPYNGGYDTEPTQNWDTSDRLVDLAANLAERAAEIAESMEDQIDNQVGSWSDNQIEALFASENFAAASQAFHRLAERTEYGSRYSVRLGLDRAYQHLLRAYDDLESISRSGVRMSVLSDCASILRRIERELGGGWNRTSGGEDQVEWNQLEENDWDGNYVKGRDATVYLIEQQGSGNFVRRPFKNLESLFKYNYDQDRGNNPWDHVAEVPVETLDRMRTGDLIERSFEGMMVIEPGTLPNRSVYLIQGGKKRGLTKAELVLRYGGWKKVYEIPKEIINAYPDGEPIL
jgi:hypothetical protein